MIEVCKVLLWVKNLIETNKGKENYAETLYKWDYRMTKSTSRERIYSETNSTREDEVKRQQTNCQIGSSKCKYNAP